MIKTSNIENSLGQQALLYKIKLIKLHSTAFNGSATATFQKCNWGQIGPTVDKGLNPI